MIFTTIFVISNNIHIAKQRTHRNGISLSHRMIKVTIEELPLERFNVEEIPLDGEIVEEHAGFTDVFFYTDLTNPYAGYVLNLQKLKAYNRLMFPLAMALNREL